MLTRVCDGCLTRLPASILTEVADGVKVCPRCALLWLLYYRNGATKRFERGCLAPSKVNREYRQICKEYDKDPVGTCTKYAPQEMKDADVVCGYFNVPKSEFDKLAGGWDFVLLSPHEAEVFKPESGKEIEARNGKRKIRRRIYAVRQFAANEGLKYRRGGFTACFVPEGE